LDDNCAELQKQNGSLIGTAFTARDAMQIVDAVQEDGLISYWGFSYGTALGATIAAMFPDRVGRLVLDGVVNPLEYYHGLVLTSRESSDDALRGFGQGCVQTPERCPLAQNRTSEEVYAYVQQLIDDARASPFVLSRPLAEGGDYPVSYTTLKGIVYIFLYGPADWSVLATILHAVATNDVATASSYIDALLDTPETSAEAEQGIFCSDTSARASTLKYALSYIEPFETSSFYDVDVPTGLACARWPFAAKERYGGDFQVKTRHPLLVVGNTWDPATPLSSGKNVSATFEGSVLLEQRGYGVRSFRVT
jgi:pimeloyl-ACP methyl ester carboxylesterase